MDLGIKERLVLSSSLPREGNLVTMRLIQDLQEELGFSEQEQEDCKFQQLDDDRVAWDQGAEFTKEIRIGPRVIVLILDALATLDQTNRLTVDHLVLCDRFGYPEHEQDKSDDAIRLQDLETLLDGPDAVQTMVELQAILDERLGEIQKAAAEEALESRRGAAERAAAAVTLGEPLKDPVVGRGRENRAPTEAPADED